MTVDRFASLGITASERWAPAMPGQSIAESPMKLAKLTAVASRVRCSIAKCTPGSILTGF